MFGELLHASAPDHRKYIISGSLEQFIIIWIGNAKKQKIAIVFSLYLSHIS